MVPDYLMKDKSERSSGIESFLMKPSKFKFLFSLSMSALVTSEAVVTSEASLTLIWRLSLEVLAEEVCFNDSSFFEVSFLPAYVSSLTIHFHFYHFNRAEIH